MARQILDSRGVPTLEVAVQTAFGAIGTASVPSGASTGTKEAVELRDNEKSYFGKGVSLACQNVNTEINTALNGVEVTDQKKIDEILIKLDGTENKARLGGNSLIGVSMACARAGAVMANLPLYEYLARLGGVKKYSMPRPMFNLINGGLHAFNGLAIQEYLFIPQVKNFSEAVRMGAETHHIIAELLKSRHMYSGVGDEGGEAPKLKSNTEPFVLIIEAAGKLGFKLGEDYGLGIDAAANSFVQNVNDNFNYKLELEGKTFSSLELIDLYEKWISDFKLVLIEDGLAETDLEGWKLMTKILSDKIHVVGQKLEIVGDDLFVTDARRLIDGVREKMANAVIIKPNQVGTVTETIATIKAAKAHNYACVASHRSGDTIDTFIADLAVGLNCEYIKAGAPARGERVAKYNRLMEISEQII